MTALAILVSLAALLWISGQDPKRRRVFDRVTPNPGRPVWPAWLVFWMAGLSLLVFGSAAGLVLWMGAVCAFGWALVAITPDGWRAIPDRLDRWGQQFEAWLRKP